ncbi:MAG: hypothetical protein Kow0068_09250 [Marinilabiliales bacterium]
MKTALIISRFGMGEGHAELTEKLITNYFKLLVDEKYNVDYICFYADGVKLVCENSPVLDYLNKLQDSGVKLIACKTCLNYYGLLDKIKTGIAGTMIDIMDIQYNVDKVITL